MKANPQTEARTDTRTLMLNVAAAHFAERGFYGASLGSIAAETGLTKQAVLHHFKTKERLYGAVLQGISQRVGDLTQVAGETAEDRAEHFFTAFCAFALGNPQDVRILMRELLDNRQRADTATNWYLAPFLRDLVALVQKTARWRTAPEPQALAVVYQLLGAVSYFAISEPTLTRIVGAAQFAEMEDIFPGELRRTVRALIRG